jgi:3-hydroxyisobutyrate dehydrogenase-like beta-hydroxyacid dehydrogenase
MKEFSNVFDERGERRICSDSAEPEKQRMQFNVYFLGIGGIGMSALARYFLHEGRRVAGYDRVRSHLTDQIEAEGAVVHYEEDPALIPADFRDPATTIVVYTTAMDCVRPGREGTDFTIQTVITHLSGMLMAILSGRIADHTGYHGLFFFEASIALISLIYIVTVFRKDKNTI